MSGFTGSNYIAYWSIYTDFRSRTDFRKLYWPRLKETIGAPAKLVGFEREDDWPSERPSRELRCHVYSYYTASSNDDAIADVVSRASHLGSPWRLLSLNPAAENHESDELAELVWYRDRIHTLDALSQRAAIPSLTSIMVTVMKDRSQRLRLGYIIGSGGEGERPTERRRVMNSGTGSYAIEWSVELQTSTKSELLQKHWPQLDRLFGPSAAMIDLQKRVGEAGAFRFKIAKTLTDVGEAIAITSALERSNGLLIQIHEPGDALILTGHADARRGKAHFHVAAVEVRRI